MDLIDTVKLVLDDAIGTRGAVRNCQVELRKQRAIEGAIEALVERIPAAPADRLENQASA